MGKVYNCSISLLLKPELNNSRLRQQDLGRHVGLLSGLATPSQQLPPHRRLRSVEQTSHWQKGPNISRIRIFLFTIFVLFLLPSVSSFFFILCFLPVPALHATGIYEYMLIFDKPLPSPSMFLCFCTLRLVEICLNQPYAAKIMKDPKTTLGHHTWHTCRADALFVKEVLNKRLTAACESFLLCLAAVCQN